MNTLVYADIPQDMTSQRQLDRQHVSATVD